ncbi:hypothetical protein B0H17DRAFT_955264, partial [Mycena rosella]
LMQSLVSLYFWNVDLTMPLLHRPIFEECTNQKLLLHHEGFVSTLLLVCAVGSLYVADTSMSKRERKALGWSWYNQSPISQPLVYLTHRVFSSQLAVEFLHRTANPLFCWFITSCGLRLAEDMGAHRRRARGPTITTEEELEKRAFWCECSIRSSKSLPYHIACPSSVSVSFDINISIECDDEYWGLSGPGRQPPETPSTVAFFIRIAIIRTPRLLCFPLN